MTLHTIHNKDEEKILRTKCRAFDFSKTTPKEMRALVAAMRKYMHEWNGVGLAATQVGRTEQFFVAQVPEKKFYALFNPRITKTEGKTVLLDEGCLSVPGIYGKVPRYEAVTLEATTHTGKPITIKATGLLAQILQHETDHLKGVLCIDTMKNQQSVNSKQ